MEKHYEKPELQMITFDVDDDVMAIGDSSLHYVPGSNSTPIIDL